VVDRYYADHVTGHSRDELAAVLERVAPPAALLGGWAVTLRVDEAFRDRHGRRYVGSRDIDLGVHVDPAWDAAELRERPVGRTLDAIRTELDFGSSRFGFTKTVAWETGERLSEDEAADRPPHESFQIDVDVIPDTDELAAFREAFGFEPPAEPLLSAAFAGAASPLADAGPWSLPVGVVLPDPHVLAAMKVRALPERTAHHKRVKDVADLYALLWYTEPIDAVIDDVAALLDAADADRFDGASIDAYYDDVASLLSLEQDAVSGPIERLRRRL
jgi:hypothetical protein